MDRSCKIIGVIPARYNSTRLPGKPLREICDRSMILHVCDQVEKSKLISKVIVATDDKRIFDHLVANNKTVIMTAQDINSGTDRCWEAVKDLNCDIVVNIQGDEPLIDPSVIDKTVEELVRSSDAVCSTPVKKISERAELDNMNVVKAVMDKNNNAMYFSRSEIPSNRVTTDIKYKHIGLYCYKFGFLKKYVEMDRTPNEIAESLEQLRILENGYKIKCVEVDYDSIGVDTEEDLEKVEAILRKREY
ncbi:MAG: 3-deoxy-manno-octulosonate cytidylyltransferase [Candidatus Delongbacteria bacterium]|nr:3-deoxy-manno-octulosonate cytidylyltransferase [Candidatus Delongbacteria bacterium]